MFGRSSFVFSRTAMSLRLLKTSATFCLLAVLCLLWGRAARGSNADTIGATELQQADPTLTGAGIAVIQAEAPVGTNASEVNPASAGLSPSIFTYLNDSGSIATSFANSVGSESGHADTVASNLAGIAPGVSSIDNYNANYYYNIVASGRTPSSFSSSLHNARIVNQSFVDTNRANTLSDDYYWDYYAARNNVLFVSAAGNSVSPPQPPSTAYNGICVNAYSLSPATSDAAGGRSIIGLTAPGSYTSFATPVVSGAAALLLQAASRGDGGTGTATAASDSRTLKALLLNGAAKPTGWSHTDTQPLDSVYGAGMVNVYQSWLELKAGNQTAAASSGTNSALQPSGNLRSSSGWNLGSLPNGTTTNHYFYTAPATGGSSDTLTATLDWNVTNWDISANPLFNNLDLALYDTSTNSLVSISDSTVDNLQHLYATNLVPGDIYDLRVYETSSSLNGGVQAYGLAYADGPGFSPVPEPSTIVLLLTSGVCGLAAAARRRAKARR